MNKQLLAATVLLLLANAALCQLQPAVVTGSREMHQDLVDMYRENAMENAGVKSIEATGNNKMGIQAMQAGRYDEAISYFTRAIAIDAIYQAPYHNRGLVEYHMHNLKAAINDFEQAYSLQDIPDIRTLNVLAKVKFDYGDYKGCAKTLDKMIKLNPRDGKVWLRKGIAENKYKEYKKAEEDLTQAIELNSGSSDTYLNKGIAEMGLKKNDDALNSLIKARQMGNRGADSLINIVSPDNAILKQPLPEIKPVVPVYTSAAIRKTPMVDANSIADANKYFSNALASARLNNMPDAINNFTLAISLNPNFADAYGNRGNAKRLLKDYPGAMDDLNKAIELKPGYSVALINRGRVEVELNKKDDACADFNKAKQLGNRGADQFIAQFCQ